MPPQKSQKDTPRTETGATSLQSAVTVVADKPRDLRARVDELFGADFKILAEGEKTAYIQNKRTGFKILKSTGERIG